MSDSTAPMVRCQDCGLLAIQDRQSRKLKEMEAGIRETGLHPSNYPRQVGFGTQPSTAPHPRSVFFEMVPVCFVRAFDLPQEYRSATAEADKEPKRGDNGKTALLLVIGKERRCSSFTAWHQGHSPREHKEMVDLQKQQEWQEQRRESDRRVDRELREENMRFQQRQKWHDRAWTLFMVLLAALLGWVFSRR